MMKRLQSAVRAATVVLVVLGCTREVPVHPELLRLGLEPKNYEFDEGFYYENGYYYWDGTPPPGESPATIYQAWTESHAPTFGTGGWVDGKLRIYGDYARTELEVTAFDDLDHYFYSEDAFDSPRIPCVERCTSTSAPRFFPFQLGIDFNPSGHAPNQWGHCGVTVETTGTGYAAHNTPWGIIVNLIRMIAGFQPTYGEVSQAMTSSNQAGRACDSAPEPQEVACDDEQTEPVEYCAPDGSPEDYPSQFLSSSTILETQETEPENSIGVLVCLQWFKTTTSQNGTVWGVQYRCISWGYWSE
jgi:hypothetical protein